MCEGRGYDETTCWSIGCCQYDDGQCWSDVGGGACTVITEPEPSPSPSPEPSPSPSPWPGRDESYSYDILDDPVEVEVTTVVTMVTISEDLSDTSAMQLATAVLSAMGVDEADEDTTFVISQSITVTPSASVLASASMDVLEDAAEVLEQVACVGLASCSVEIIQGDGEGQEGRRLQVEDVAFELSYNVNPAAQSLDAPVDVGEILSEIAGVPADQFDVEDPVTSVEVTSVGTNEEMSDLESGLTDAGTTALAQALGIEEDAIGVEVEVTAADQKKSCGNKCIRKKIKEWVNELPFSVEAFVGIIIASVVTFCCCIAIGIGCCVGACCSCCQSPGKEKDAVARPTAVQLSVSSAAPPVPPADGSKI